MKEYVAQSPLARVKGRPSPNGWSTKLKFPSNALKINSIIFIASEKGVGHFAS